MLKNSFGVWQCRSGVVGGAISQAEEMNSNKFKFNDFYRFAKFDRSTAALAGGRQWHRQTNSALGRCVCARGRPIETVDRDRREIDSSQMQKRKYHVGALCAMVHGGKEK